MPSFPPPCLQSIDALADALEEFEGGVFIISHDARLLSRICDDGAFCCCAVLLPCTLL